MKQKPSAEFESFDRIMSGLLAVPRSELQKELGKEEHAKAKKKKRPTSTASSHASSSRTKRAA